jgi:pimeloyl-ACP methyl ester carboxylesterase
MHNRDQHKAQLPAAIREHPPATRTVSRRGFLAGMSASALALGVFASLTDNISIVSAAELPTDGARPAAQRANTEGATPMMNATSSPTTATSGQNLPTVVLVHGAFAESSSWNGVVAELLESGYPVVAAANPLRSVKSDAAYVAGLLASISGPIVLVGHSYGGCVITNAVDGKSNVVALVYVAAFAPEAGETAAGLSGQFPGSTLGPTLAPPVTLSDGGVDLYIQLDKFHDQFAADVSAADAKLMAATQRPITGGALNEASEAPAWKNVPSWSVYGDLDKNIPAAAHAFMAERASMKDVVAVKGASHVVMTSNPQVVAEVIRNAAAVTVPA